MCELLVFHQPQVLGKERHYNDVPQEWRVAA